MIFKDFLQEFESYDYPIIPTFNVYAKKVDDIKMYYHTAQSTDFLNNIYKDEPFVSLEDGHNTGPVLEEIKLLIEDIALKTHRFYHNGYYEIDFVIIPKYEEDGGPVQMEELTAKYKTYVSDGHFFVDTDGREISNKPINYVNYHPASNLAYLASGHNKMGVVFDRPHNVRLCQHSDDTPCIEVVLLGARDIMNHKDAIDENKVLRITHRKYLFWKNMRMEALKMNLRPLVFVSKTDLSIDEWVQLPNEYSWVNDWKYPENFHLLSLEPWGTNMLVRLENLGDIKNITVNLAYVFKNILINSAKETILSGNKVIVDADSNDTCVRNEFRKGRVVRPLVKYKSNNDFEIQLLANQIRTFVVDYDYV